MITADHSPGDLLDVRIDRIVPGGHGIAFADGLTIFVDLAAVGDRLWVRLREKKGKIAFADIDSIIEPSPSRIEPPCPYVGSCGGCNFQQMSYSAQLESKVGIIRDCLRRIGKLDFDPEIHVVPSPAEFGYRLRAQWHIDGARNQIGYYRRDSRDLIAIEHCPILSPELDAALQQVRNDIDWVSFWPDKGAIDAACGDNAAVSIHSAALGLDGETIELTAAGEDYAFSSKVFFQGNKFLIDALIDAAIGDAAGKTALDLYSGVGLFTLPLARRFQRVISVEEFAPAIEFARKNVAKGGHQNVDIVRKPVGRYLVEQRKLTIDFALLDPPRAGTEKKTVLDLIRLRPRHVSYVSCDPSVLARDLRRFLDAGYQIDSITALDLFPQTHHVETIVRLREQ